MFSVGSEDFEITGYLRACFYHVGMFYLCLRFELLCTHLIFFSFVLYYKLVVLVVD